MDGGILLAPDVIEHKGHFSFLIKGKLYCNFISGGRIGEEVEVTDKQG